MKFELLLTPLITVSTGVLVYIIGQFIQEIYIKPLQEYHKIKSDVSFLLVYYANIYMNPFEYNKLSEEGKKEREKASKELREAAARLAGFKQISPHSVKKDEVTKASKGLIGLSNGMYSTSTGIDIRIEQNQEYENEIREALNLK